MDNEGRRVGLNEAVYREVNERLRDVNQSFATLTDRMELICECGRADCEARLSMSPQDYEALRADPALFAIVPGHEAPSVERVVERRNGYAIVRKHAGAPTRLAEQTQPRE